MALQIAIIKQAAWASKGAAESGSALTQQWCGGLYY
jgi:hypothetical protein